MGAFGVVFETEHGRGGTRQVAKRFHDLADRSQNAAPAFRKIHKSFLAAERSRFAGANDWAPLTAKYRKYKAAHGLDPRIMRATGELHRALTTGAGPGAVTNISHNEAEFGTNLQKAVYAQRTTGRKRRRVLVITKARRAKWARILHDYLVEGNP